MTESNKKRSPLKDRQLRYPGQSLDSEIEKIRLNIALYIVLVSIFIVLAFYEFWHWYRNLPPQPILAIVVATVIVIYSSVKVRQSMKRLSSIRLGQKGEREVAQTLDRLSPKGYTVYHDVLAPRFNIDHVVVSPHGVFAIEVKTRSKPLRGEATVSFDGEKVTLTGCQPDPEPIKEARRHADWLSRVLGSTASKKSFTVQPVVVFPGWWHEPTRTNKRIWVLNPDQLEGRIAKEPTSLTVVDMEVVKARLELYATTPT